MTNTGDTTELRWFADGPLPSEVLDWLTDRGSAGALEHRADTYRVDDRADVGVKHRSLRTLELKQRLAVRDILELEPGLAGPIEEWRRWSPAGDRVTVGTDDIWLEVRKRTYKRRFIGDATETRWTSDIPIGVVSGCDVEVTSLTIGEVESWTFALAAFGPAERRVDALVMGWNAIRGPELPDGFIEQLRLSCGYPEWLAERAHSGV